MLCELVPRPSASCDCYRSRAERFTASDVARGVADNVDLRCGKLLSVLLLRASTSESAELIPVAVIIGKCAEFEKMPNAIVLEF